MIGNRHGLAFDALLIEANGRTEREAALRMAARLPGGRRRVTLGADKGYDTANLVACLREWDVTPHVAQNVSPFGPIEDFFNNLLKLFGDCSSMFADAVPFHISSLQSM